MSENTYNEIIEWCMAFVIILLIILWVNHLSTAHKIAQIEDAMQNATCDAYAYDQEIAPLHCNVIYLDSK